MKPRRQCTHDPHYHVQKYDRYGRINPAWKAAYQKTKKRKSVPKPPKL